MAKQQPAQPQAPAPTAMEAIQKEQITTIRHLLERSKDQIAACLPSHMDAGRMLRIAITVCQRSPGLLECHPTSIVACTMLASELGLELSGPLGQAYMIPRRNKHQGNRKEAVFQIGYRGFQHLAYNSGKVTAFPMHTVYANDTFSINFGTDAKIVHHPKLTGSRGNQIGYYCIAKLLPAGEDFDFMTHAEMVAHRAKYAGDNKIWDSDWEAMALKTVVRRLCKRLPVSPTLVRAAAVDEYAEANVRMIPNSDRMADATAGRLSALRDRLEGHELSDMLPPDAMSSQPAEQQEQQPAQAGEVPANEDEPISSEAKAEIGKLFKKTGWTAEVQSSFLQKWGVDNSDLLTPPEGREIIAQLLAAVGGKK